MSNWPLITLAAVYDSLCNNLFLVCFSVICVFLLCFAPKKCDTFVEITEGCADAAVLVGVPAVWAVYLCCALVPYTWMGYKHQLSSAMQSWQINQSMCKACAHGKVQRQFHPPPIAVKSVLVWCAYRVSPALTDAVMAKADITTADRQVERETRVPRTTFWAMKPQISNRFSGPPSYQFWVIDSALASSNLSFPTAGQIILARRSLASRNNYFGCSDAETETKTEKNEDFSACSLRGLRLVCVVGILESVQYFPNTLGSPLSE